MGKVYSYGLLNIAATGSADGEGGLFRERPSRLPLKSTACYISSCWTDHSNSHLLIHAVYLPDRMLLDGPLLSRGWVLQERIMSKRILHFGGKQLYWECNEHDCCEIYPTGVPDLWTRPNNGRFFKRNIPDLFIKPGSNSRVSPFSSVSEMLAARFSGNASQAEIFIQGVVHQGLGQKLAQEFLKEVSSQMQMIDFWNCIVSIYSRCALTIEQDKLVALAGVARAMKEQMGCDYLAGMWRSDLERNLLWSVGSTFRRPKEYRAPSWSWASIDGEIGFLERGSKITYVLEIEILCAGTQKKSADEMGQVEGGALRVRGPLMSLSVRKSEDFKPLPLHITEDLEDFGLPEQLVRINGVWNDGDGGGLRIDGHESFDTLLKDKIALSSDYK